MPQITHLFTETDREKIVALLLESIQDRFTDGLDANDDAASSYSPHGPIYLPLTHGSRTAKSLQPRYSLSRRKAKSQAKLLKEAYEEAQAWGPVSGGSGAGVLSRTGNSMRFQDYEEMKVFLGHPGHRDLELSGTMRRAIMITENAPEQVALGFLDSTQEGKMRRNDAICNQWGISPRDGQRIEALFEQILDQRIAAL